MEKYFYQLCVAISETKNIQEAAELLRDLLSYPEAEMIAKRLKIAEMILNNATYDEIIKVLKVSPTTIARVQEWIKVSGEGYQRAVTQMKGKELDKTKRDYNFGGWSVLKKRYPSYYWPQILLESIVEGANAKQKRRLENVINQMEKMKEKSAIFYQIRKLVKKQ